MQTKLLHGELPDLTLFNVLVIGKGSNPVMSLRL